MLDQMTFSSLWESEVQHQSETSQPSLKDLRVHLPPINKPGEFDTVAFSKLQKKMSETSMTTVEEQVLFSSSFGFQMPLRATVSERTKVRRRRRKANEGEGDGGGNKRRLSEEQVEFLERSFSEEKRLETGRKDRLAAKLGLDSKQVAVWFQNRRARNKNKQMVEDYTKLKTAHAAAVVEKYHLENEVLKLKQRLGEAEEQIRKHSPAMNAAPDAGVGDGSPSSCFSSVLPLAGEFGVEGGAELTYKHDYDYNSYMTIMEWAVFNDHSMEF